MLTHRSYGRGPAAARRRRTWLAAGLIVVSIAVAGAVIRATSAGAGSSTEPSAFAQRGSLAATRVTRLGAEAAKSTLKGRDLVPGRGKAKGKTFVLGGGDEVIAAITGSFTPVAVESADGNVFAYSSWHLLADPKPDTIGQGLNVGQPVGIPSVRVFDASKGKDKLVANGAYSPALSSDGRLAFVKGDENAVRQNVDYTGQVLVGTVGGNAFTRWTSATGRYFAYGWAGDALLVYRALPDSEATDLFAYTGPGEGRLLAPQAFV